MPSFGRFLEYLVDFVGSKEEKFSTELAREYLRNGMQDSSVVCGVPTVVLQLFFWLICDGDGFPCWQSSTFEALLQTRCWRLQRTGIVSNLARRGANSARCACVFSLQQLAIAGM